MTTQNLLFEIGTEEIPSGYFAQAKASILRKLPGLAEECGHEYDALEIHTTPRRIVMFAKNFKSSGVLEEEKLGPSKEQSYQDGKPTPALLGFLRSAGANESQILFKDTPKGPRAAIKVKKQVKPLKHLFETLPKLIEFPKLMRWDKTNQKFVRPIRWTFAFVGTKKQNYKIGDVQSADFTFGHRFLSKGKLKVGSADLDAYEKLLEKHHVILKFENRLALISDWMKKANNHDIELAETVANLTEEPYPVFSVFDKKYLELPQEVLVTCMRKNQKIFSCHDASGKMKNQFLAVINGKRPDLKLIARNYENVLKSRLEDARFFYNEDTKTKLDAKLPKLNEMVFLGQLGSYFDKTKRLSEEVGFLGKKAGLDQATVQHAVTGALLAKADLGTHLVYEFPELQGLAGSAYAKHDGQPPQVVRAILGQYLPRSLNENYSGLKNELTVEGALVSLADKMDLLVGALGIGIEPSSSQDPYALRRAAGSIVKILRAHPFHVSLHEWIQHTAQLFGKKISKPVSEFEPKLISFFKERLAFELGVKMGSKEYELLQAVMKVNMDDIANIYARFEQLKLELPQKTFAQACKVMERTFNITKGAGEKIPDTIDPALFQDDKEKRLFDLIQNKSSSIQDLIQKEEYATANRLYGETFYGPLHDFFDGVMVNVEDVKVRANRQALMKQINRLHSERIADLSQMTPLL